MAQVLVTGATGFIGRQLVPTLLAEGHSVRALVRDAERARSLLPARTELAPGDVLDETSLERAIDGVDEVYHLASLLKMPWHPDFGTVNAEGTRRLAAACALAKAPPRLVVVSSLAAAGPSPEAQPRDETQPPAPVSRYGRVKLDAEQAALGYADRVPMTIVRPPMVFGPHDRSALNLYRSAQRGIHVVPTWAQNRMSMIHVEDLAEALVLVGARGERAERSGAESPIGRGVYYVAHEERPLYAEFGGLIAASMQWPAPRVVRLPFPVTWLAALGSELLARLRDRPTLLNLDKATEAKAGSWICRADKLREQLGFEPAPVRARMASTGAWYTEKGWL